MSFALNAEHLESITLYVQALNDADSSIDDILQDDDKLNRKVGDGHLAALAPIEVRSDAAWASSPEVIGWLHREEFGWTFTQEKPNVA